MLASLVPRSVRKPFSSIFLTRPGNEVKCCPGTRNYTPTCCSQGDVARWLFVHDMNILPSRRCFWFHIFLPQFHGFLLWWLVHTYIHWKRQVCVCMVVLPLGASTYIHQRWQVWLYGGVEVVEYKSKLWWPASTWSGHNHKCTYKGLQELMFARWC